jgi:multicomponent Na+:H+ antiporter subunit F
VSPQSFSVHVVLPLLSGGLVAAVARLVRGPSLPDRVVAFDLLSALGMCFLAAYSVMTDQDVFIDVTVILALVSFLGTIGFAFYLRRRG